jgi:hypothetical protein
VVQGAAAQGGTAMKKNSVRERGQALVLVALLMVVFMGMLMLVLEGALAASAVLCLKDYTPEAAKLEGEKYAIQLNGADTANVQINAAAKEVTVTTKKGGNTFFGGLFGFNEISASATAGANCCSPFSGSGMIPMGFFCRTWDPDSDSPACGVKLFLPTDAVPHLLPTNPEWKAHMVIFGTSEPTWEKCIQNGYDSTNPDAVDCQDPDGDGVANVYGDNGTRGWLDLFGKYDKNNYNINTIISQEIQSPYIVPNLWVGPTSGVTNSTFGEVYCKLTLGKNCKEPLKLFWETTVPIFNKYCQVNGPPHPDTPCNPQAPYDPVLETDGLGKNYYRLAGVGRFRVTCVDYQGQPSCPYRLDSKLFTKGGKEDASISTIEGYFIKGNFDQMDRTCGGIDFGQYLIPLNK